MKNAQKYVEHAPKLSGDKKSWELAKSYIGWDKNNSGEETFDDLTSMEDHAGKNVGL